MQVSQHNEHKQKATELKEVQETSKAAPEGWWTRDINGCLEKNMPFLTTIHAERIAAPTDNVKHSVQLQGAAASQ